LNAPAILDAANRGMYNGVSLLLHLSRRIFA
jgi:hypothetical protein